MTFHVIIPARYNSTRLPGKVLLDIGGKPMIQRVYERAQKSAAESITIATDDERIAEVCEGFGADVCMTDSSHRSGTLRVAEAVEAGGFDKGDIIINLQADEPVIPKGMIGQLAEDLETHELAKVATLGTPIKTMDELFDPNVVKVILNYRHFAIYFSRAPIPWNRDHFSDLNEKKNLNGTLISDLTNYYRHIGLYAFRAGFLETFANWSTPFIEKTEDLEQLRILHNGYKIHVGLTELQVPTGVDTKQDLEHLRAVLA